MAVTIKERARSRELTDGKAHERTYIIRGTDDEATALSTLKAEAPTTSNSLTRGDCSVEPIGIASDGAGGFLNPGAWLGTAPYAPSSDSDASDLALNDIIVTYNTGGGSQHVTQSLGTSDSDAVVGTATDHKEAIGVTDDGVEGVDIGVRQMDLVITKCFAVGSLPDPGDVHALTWTVNDDTFSVTDSRTTQTFSFSAGEVVLKGVSGPRMRSDGLAELTMRMGAAPNVTGFAIGDMSVDKDGWEYAWARYEKTKDAVSKRMASRPFECYVEQVYDLGDFTDLGL